MLYLAIMFVVAFAGIARLWLHQRRLHAHMNSVEGFQASLQRLAFPAPPKARRTPVLPGLRPAPWAEAGKPFRQPAPLDARRRAAAKARLTARRQARADAGHTSVGTTTRRAPARVRSERERQLARRRAAQREMARRSQRQRASRGRAVG